MTEESTTHDLVELTRRRVDAADSGDIDAMTSFLAQDAVWDSSPMGLEVYEGRAAIHSGLEDWWGAFDVSEAEAEEILNLGNGATFALVTLTARPPGGRGQVQLRYAAVSTWGQGVIVRETNYTDIDEARAAAERLAGERG